MLLLAPSMYVRNIPETRILVCCSNIVVRSDIDILACVSHIGD
jgi:hypothetical protein